MKQDECLWRAGKWEGLCPVCADKLTQTWMWTNKPRTSYGRFKLYIMLHLPQICAQECSKGWYFQCIVWSRNVGCSVHVAVVLWYLSYRRHQISEVLSETNYCGTVNVLDAADTDGNSKCRINNSLYARRLSDFLHKVSQHLFYYFHNSFY